MKYIKDNGGWKGIPMDLEVGPDDDDGDNNDDDANDWQVNVGNGDEDGDDAYVRQKKRRAEMELQQMIERLSLGGQYGSLVDLDIDGAEEDEDAADRPVRSNLDR